MTAVKTFDPRRTPKLKKILSRHSHLMADGPLAIAFLVYGSKADEYTVTIRKTPELRTAIRNRASQEELIQLGNLMHNTRCTCEFDREHRRNDEKVCWHIYRALISYLDRIRRGDVMELLQDETAAS